jgi:hypothetical protein
MHHPRCFGRSKYGRGWSNIPTGAALGATVRGPDLAQPFGGRDFARLLLARGRHGVLRFPRQRLAASREDGCAVGCSGELIFAESGHGLGVRLARALSRLHWSGYNVAILLIALAVSIELPGIAARSAPPSRKRRGFASATAPSGRRLPIFRPTAHASSRRSRRRPAAS